MICAATFRGTLNFIILLEILLCASLANASSSLLRSASSTSNIKNPSPKKSSSSNQLDQINYLRTNSSSSSLSSSDFNENDSTSFNATAILVAQLATMKTISSPAGPNANITSSSSSNSSNNDYKEFYEFMQELTGLFLLPVISHDTRLQGEKKVLDQLLSHRSLILRHHQTSQRHDVLSGQHCYQARRQSGQRHLLCYLQLLTLHIHI